MSGMSHFGSKSVVRLFYISFSATLERALRRGNENIGLLLGLGKIIIIL